MNQSNEKQPFNPVGLCGIEFIEFASPSPLPLEKLFVSFGFAKLKQHSSLKVDYYRQHDIHWLLNYQPNSFASQFAQLHGPSICSMGWRVKNAKEALKIACERGARACSQSDYRDKHGHPVPAIYGIGDSLIYFIDHFKEGKCYEEMGFESVIKEEASFKTKGFAVIDHLTNNVPNGTMSQWADFYKNIFGFTEVRYFDIKGKKTGLTSFALRSPDGSFCIPINEASDEKSQINEYLVEYKGAGIQHVALLTQDIVRSLRELKADNVQMLEVEPDYYQKVFNRVPNVTENHQTLQELGILIDGDAEGYLLQIFTQNLIGPIFFEIIQRKNHLSFGEGNFGALFRSIERDQEKRGVL
ncbi:MAG: 4-hydroxyphenylpyruvate dioxygenase [Proteobacteria bacterium]|nr:4-hydroxyphenylpyruvate dioxygenase [Pseudomonadota bacterium]NDC25081.1 4-hydroxyphenylpyruvate dioxygenase [Pseudomonadota bacterium]NDD04932.1 4-hydroxyphenylpyruvate dioxygenase [Pseudomonadota bacterium]NDG27323.1 4-hydroxyphenylpyruvate dioxygenase [Pseudomonadota bacterium]